MRNSANHAAKQAGFTLIELLVVVAIIAVIAAILFPVFATVRERGRRTVCQSNLKQIAIAMQQYVQDNGGTYPPSINWEDAAYSYTKSAELIRCPDLPDDESPDVHYTYDLTWLNVFPPPYPPKKVQGARESMLATPSSIWLNRDASWITPDGKCHYCRLLPTTSCGREFGGSIIHSGAANYSYVDGHVKWLTTEDAGEVECLNGPLPPQFKN